MFALNLKRRVAQKRRVHGLPNQLFLIFRKYRIVFEHMFGKQKNLGNVQLKKTNNARVENPEIRLMSSWKS